MKKNRFIFCLLACGFMLYFAVPRLSVTANGAYGIFSAVWLLFALLVIAGNLAGILYQPKINSQRKHSGQVKRLDHKSRSYDE